MGICRVGFSTVPMRIAPAAGLPPIAQQLPQTIPNGDMVAKSWGSTSFPHTWQICLDMTALSFQPDFCSGWEETSKLLAAPSCAQDSAITGFIPFSPQKTNDFKFKKYYPRLHANLPSSPTKKRPSKTAIEIFWKREPEEKTFCLNAESRKGSFRTLRYEVFSRCKRFFLRFSSLTRP
jgi:hypothetical protein